jgi:hypothetical protein
MKRMFLAYLVLILAVPSSFACKPEVPGQRQAFKRAVSVFIGEVVNVAESDLQPVKGKRYFVSVTFKVLQYWKGRGAPEITVRSEQGALSCNLFRFERGEKYLVYAYGKHLTVFTGSSRSAPLSWSSYVNDELRMLGKSRKPNTT